MKINAQYDPSAPFDGNVEYGMANAYTLVQALVAAGKDLTRQGLVNAVNNDGGSWTGPGSRRSATRRPSMAATPACRWLRSSAPTSTRSARC